MTKVLMIDNFDSFVHNLSEEFKKRGCDVDVYRNGISMKELAGVVLHASPDIMVLSPGPAAPSEAGNLEKIIRDYHRDIPVFGVCLGHQAIAEVFGGAVRRAPEIIHGKMSQIYHNGNGIYEGVENPFPAARYHSLAAYELPDCLEETAYTLSKDGRRIAMGLRHKEYSVEGVQFHPESIMTIPHGGIIIDNLLRSIDR